MVAPIIVVIIVVFGTLQNIVFTKIYIPKRGLQEETFE